MSRLGWYARRLRAMSLPEFAWRTTSVARSAGERWSRPPTDAALLGTTSPDWAEVLAGFRAAAGRPVLLDRDRGSALAATRPEEVAAVVAAADRVVEGRVQYFGYPGASLGRPVDWNLDPVSGTRWPAVRASRLDHRSAPGDAKWIWELNRLQHLPWLAQAWLFTGEERYAATAFDHLDTWIAQNPVGTGIAWRGAFEAGVRLVSVDVALQGLRDSPLLTPSRYGAYVRLIAQSMQRCWVGRSRFSSANNHLVGELTGLAVGALLHPELARSPRDLRRALHGLAREARLQVLPDGAGAEQAFAYQVFTGDLLLVVAALLRLAGRPVPPPITAALRRSATYIAAVIGEADPVPRYGDDDEGFALRLDVEQVPRARRHLGALAAVIGEPVAAQYGESGMTAAWFAGERAAPVRGDAPDPGDHHFADGGLVVLRSAGRRLTMDIGPLGYLSIAAHGHADALSVTLSLDGVEVVGDPGAGSYYGHGDWRAIHRGTRVHATATVDAADQSVMGGPFLWTARATTTVHRVDLVAGVVDAEHDGYARLAAPVRHRRWLIAPPGEPTVVVVDRVTGVGVHEVRASWPLHPDLDAAPVEGGHTVLHGGQPLVHICYAAAPRADTDAVRGDVRSGLGWWSERLESRRPAWLVGAVTHGEVPLLVASIFHPATGTSTPANPAVSAEGELITVTWSVGGYRHGVEVDGARRGAVRSLAAVAGAGGG
jgi:hypothetical protein